jgi:hypothetical protein
MVLAVGLLGGCSSTGPSSLDGEWNEPAPEKPRPPTTSDGGVHGDNGDPLPVSNDGGSLPTPTPVATTAPVAENVTISEVAFFQTVKVPLMKNGATQTPKAPVVAGRPALLRVYVTPGSGWSPHAIQAQVTLDGGGTKTTLVADATPTVASTDAAITSTFNVEVPGDQLKPDTKYSIVLREKSGTKAQPATSPAMWPADGSLTNLGAVSTGPQLKVVLVPIQYGADGSGRLPDLSAGQIQKYKDLLFALYPTPMVSITVRPQPVAISYAVTASGNGWNQLLTQILGVRGGDAPDKDVYYYGIFSPSASFGAYCGNGCVVGLSPVITNAGDAASRASIGVGFTGDVAAESLVHELGHAHGRNHAPCGGVAGPDPSYPYSGGALGSWGYSLVSKTLKDPAQFKDLMGYCNPGWFSDYSYNALVTRVKTVNNAQMVTIAPRTWRYASVAPSGALTWVGSATLTEQPGGEPRKVVFEASDGTPLGEDTGYLLVHDHVAGGTLLAPEGPTGTARTRLEAPSLVFGPKL